MKGELETLARSYDRLSRDVGGRIDFACDLDSDDALRAAQQEEAHLDQAFFVLCFAALEKQITLLATARLEDDSRRSAMREANFANRLQTATRVARETLGSAPTWSAAAPIIQSWYGIRNDIAHGESPTQLFDVSEVIYRANDIAVTLDQVKLVI